MRLADKSRLGGSDLPGIFLTLSFSYLKRDTPNTPLFSNCYVDSVFFLFDKKEPLPNFSEAGKMLRN